MAADLAPHPLVAALGLGILDIADRATAYRIAVGSAKAAKDGDTQALLEQESIRLEFVGDTADSETPPSEPVAGETPSSEAGNSETPSSEPVDPEDLKNAKEIVEALKDSRVDHGWTPPPPEKQKAGAPTWRRGLNQALANELAKQEEPTDLVTLRGYLGAAAHEDWQRLYLDHVLVEFLSVRARDIILRHRFHDETEPFDQIDVIWLRHNAPVSQGRRRPRAMDEEARFLQGDLVDAGDLADALAGGGRPATGPLCTGTCCRRASHLPGRGRG